MERIVVPGYPHHVTQRGSRRLRTFFDDSDYHFYLSLLRAVKGKAGLDVWAYCLMPNHVHLVVVPARPDSLAKAIGVTHQIHARRINAARGWQGHLWQERFHSFPMDEKHLLATVRYVELNPVRAGLCATAEDWPWSSVHEHLRETPDGLVAVSPMRERIPDWQLFLADHSGPDIEVVREHTSSGRPAGDDVFLSEVQTLTGKKVRSRRRIGTVTET